MALLTSLPLKKLLPISLVLGILAISLQWFLLSNQSPDLPPPQTACNTDASWRGIQPGKSSRQDVVDILGQPQETGMKGSGATIYSYFTYTVDGGVIAEYATDRIFFHLDGVVAWMEIVAGDRNGSYGNISDLTVELGTTLDTIFMNNNYDPRKNQIDVLGGPDQLYIWSECGLALDVLPYCSISENGDVKCSFDAHPGNNPTGANIFSLRYPNPYNAGGEPPPNEKSIVLMKFLFPPTTYETFVDYYMYKIPFGLWDEYIKTLDWNP